MNEKKVIVCDLDGTLAPSKSTISEDMADVISKLLLKYKVAVISGGAYPQFEKQFISKLSSPSNFQNLYLFPTMGSTCYVWDVEKTVWNKLYSEDLKEEDRKEIVQALESLIKDEGMDVLVSYGERVEDRGTQITFSALGQEAPLDLKEKWDPDQKKREFPEETLAVRIRVLLRSVIRYICVTRPTMALLRHQ